MNTNNIKSFAKEARLLLLDGVFHRLKYWGFQEDGTNAESLQTTQGGYIFRGKPYTDVSVPSKWNKLKTKLKNEQDVKDVVEEASYTWFNRLMAIKILETNGYIPKQLVYTQGLRTPLIVQNAKRGEHSITKPAEKELLIEYLKEDKDEEAFSLLITNLCHTNTLLHDIFGSIDDYTEILFPQNSLKIDGLLDLINSDAIIEEDFKEVELIGWLYQFYISDKKDEVFKGFKKNIKARAEDIPAATQIFTPKWIVKYMVENTVGKIYLDFEPDSDLRDQMKYLVENESDMSPRAQSRGLISDLTQLTLIDPAAGSGHILVTGFELLFKMYREAGYTSKQAAENILKNNLFGLDIDDRAMQLARFAVLLKAAQYDPTILEDSIMPHVYSFPEDTLVNWFTQTYYSKSQSNWHDLLGMKLVEPVSIEWEETKKGKTKTKKVTYKKGVVLNEAIIDLLELHGDEPIAVDYAQELELFWGDFEKPRNYSEFFYAIDLLRQGKNLGSAIKLNISIEVYTHLKEQYHSWLLREQTAELSLDELSVFNLLKPFLEVVFVLAKKYKAVVANPPYMGSGNMNSDLKNYVNEQYPRSKSDLFAIFMESSIYMNSKNGLMGMINQHAWMFLSTYEKLRVHILSNYSIISMLHLGPRTFQELSGEVVQSTAFVIQNNSKIKKASYYRLVNYRNIYEKEKNFLKGNNILQSIPQNQFSTVPGSPLAYWLSSKIISAFELQKIDKYAISEGQNITGNNEKYLKLFWELDSKRIAIKSQWELIAKGGSFRKWYGNIIDVINWSNSAKEHYRKNKIARIQPDHLWFRPGITWNLTAGSKPAFRLLPVEYLFNKAAPTILFENDDENKINFFMGLLNSKVSFFLLNVLNPTLSINIAEVLKIPFSWQNDKEIIDFVKKAISISQADWDSREISWDFKQSPLVNEGNTLKEAYQNWQNSVTQAFFQLHANEEELNRIFIDIYGLQEELTPEVALKDITILLEELNGKDLEALEPVFREKGKVAISLPINKTEVLSQYISYAIGLFMGRYRLDKPGLNIAHPNPTEQELASYNVIAKNEAISRTVYIDDDGIVPLMGEDCAFPDDALTRTKDLLLTIWGENALTENINFLREVLGMDLHKWLTEKFWGYHTSMYKKKPIYWLFSSNVKKPQNAAFKVLVYMHRMDKYTAQQIQRNYLYPHQEYIKNEIDKLAQEEDSLNREQQKRLELLRDWELECRDYNEVLKTIAYQQIEIDLDDGVTVNYAKFEGAVAKI